MKKQVGDTIGGVPVIAVRTEVRDGQKFRVHVLEPGWAVGAAPNQFGRHGRRPGILKALDGVPPSADGLLPGMDEMDYRRATSAAREWATRPGGGA